MSPAPGSRGGHIILKSFQRIRRQVSFATTAPACAASMTIGKTLPLNYELVSMQWASDLAAAGIATSGFNASSRDRPQTS